MPNVQVFNFCPEDFSFGTPRALCNIHGGDGFDVGEWLPRSGERVGEGVSFEIYRNHPGNAEEAELRTELFVPLA
jgi:hypothetical protein